MKYQSVKRILMAAHENLQHGLIKYGSDSVDFDFTASAVDKGEENIIGYDSDTEVISVLGKARNAYIDCDAIECIEVYK